MALDQTNINSGQRTDLANSDSCVVTNVQHAAKRRLNGSEMELEPVIKQEKLDSGYDKAVLNRTGTLLGTIVPTRPVILPVPHPVTVLTSSALSLRNRQPYRGRPQRPRGAARSNKTMNVDIVNGRNSRMLSRPVVLLPHGGVPLPRQVPLFLPPQPLRAPTVQLPTHGLTTLSVTAVTSAPVVVLVSRPSAPRARIVCTTYFSTSTTTSPCVTYTTIRLPSVPGVNGMRMGHTPLDRLKAIIGKSVLEKYVGPHEPPPELCMPARCKHICQGCGDEFVTIVGLVDHLSRRSLVISFHCTCSLSKWPQRFYNPCMFQSFYQSHCVRPGVHAPRNSVVISALDLDTPEYHSCLAAQNHQKNVAAMSETEVSQSLQDANSQEPVTTTADSNSGYQRVPEAAPVKEIFVNLEVMPNDSEQMESSKNADGSTANAVVKKLKRNCINKPTKAGLLGKLLKEHPQNQPVADCVSFAKVVDFFSALSRNRTTCPECPAVYTTRRWLAAHFSEGRNKRPVPCTECKLSLPTTCSFRAHRRIHENQPPFVCPQCGIIFDEAESMDVFRAHVERYCLHLIRSSFCTSTYNCPQCTFSLPGADIEKIARHFIDVHATVYYKCRSCPKAFSNTSAAKRHSENTGHEAQKDIVRKCPMCDGVFKERAGIEMQLHVIEHLTKMPGEFCCPLCPKRASLQSVIVEHMQLCHPEEILPATTCEVCGQPYACREELFTHVSTKHVDYFESVMKCLPTTRDKKSASAATVESGSTTDCTEETLLIQETEVQSNTSSVEPSNTTSFNTPETSPVSESEIRSIPSSTEVFECTQCQMNFDSRDVYKRHQARHRFLKSKKARKMLHAAAKCSDDPLQQVFCFACVC